MRTICKLIESFILYLQKWKIRMISTSLPFSLRTAPEQLSLLGAGYQIPLQQGSISPVKEHEHLNEYFKNQDVEKVVMLVVDNKWTLINRYLPK